MITDYYLIHRGHYRVADLTIPNLTAGIGIHSGSTSARTSHTSRDPDQCRRVRRSNGALCASGCDSDLRNVLLHRLWRLLSRLYWAQLCLPRA
ncbi:hypothetical protein BDZ89DRAFT_1229270, partial [Hymenopellis radicata]